MHETVMTAPVSTDLFIGGHPRPTPERRAIADPARPGVTVGYAASASAADVGDAVAAAKAAYPAWSGLTAAERADLMREAITGIDEDRDADAAVLTQENGKIRAEAWVDGLVFELRWRGALELADQVESSLVLKPAPHAPVETTVSYQSLGVVSIIVPFNWPLAILAAALPFALLAGNTVIVKPPLTAPLATTTVVQRVAAKLPAGVLNIVTGEDANMSGLIRNADVAKVSFTGSVNGGKKIMELASASLTRVTLELGGNDAAVILADAPLDDLHLDRLFNAVYQTSGQVCMNAKRIYVHHSRKPEVIDGLSSRLAKVQLGHGLEEATTMGPLHSPAQKAFVDGLIAEAKAAGAEVREFGELPGNELVGGNFVRPAIVIDPDPTLGVVVEEQFGPVVPIISFDDEDQAVSLANDTWAALGGSVWTADPETARRIGSQIVAGYVWVNDHGADRLDLRAPFGGLKASGMGREQGIDGIRDFQDTRSIAFLDEAAISARD